MRKNYILKRKPLHFCLAFIYILMHITACKKVVEVDPPSTSLNSENVYQSDATAIAVLTGIYIKTSKSFFGGLDAVSLYTALSGDELTLFNASSTSATQYSPYFTNTITSENTGGADFATNIYPLIFEVNSAIEHLTGQNALSPGVRRQLLGEARFIRAFCYFNLTNLYGDVPLAKTTDYKINSVLRKSPVAEVYALIKEDLLSARELLATTYVSSDATSSTDLRVRPNTWAATAMLARASLYMKDFSNAEKYASSIIVNTTSYDTVSLNQAFLMNNKEAIWQLDHVTAPSVASNTQEAKFFVLPAAGPTLTTRNPVYLNDDLIKSFQADDKRLAKWTSSVLVTIAPATPSNPATTKRYYYAYKYKGNATASPLTEYLTVLRLSEQYLIRAEAKAMLNDLTGSISDLNVIRKKAGLANLVGLNQNDLINAILLERRHELFTEWGHRWFDLKRTNTIDNVMPSVSLAKGVVWDPNHKVYPFNIYDLSNNPNLKQNIGY